MVRYSLDPENPTKSCKSRGWNLLVHFKNFCETAQVTRGMHTWKLTKYLKDGTLQKQYPPPFHCYRGRCAQAEGWGWVQARWPQKCWIFTARAQNAESNAALKDLDLWPLSISREQSPKDAARDLDQPRHELPLPRWDNPYWKRTDCS